MADRINGIHHITAIAGDAKRNLDFYTKVLGLRLVKKTVNFDDPHTYHLYYGNHGAEPGTIFTFFPWSGIQQGRRGTGQATETQFSVPADTFGFWIKRFNHYNVTYNNPSMRFNEEYLTFLDPDGLKLQLVANSLDKREPAHSSEIPDDKAVRGFHGVTLTLEHHERTASLLTDVFGYTLEQTEINAYRFTTDASENAAIVDLVSIPGEHHGLNGGGTIHHVAFRVENDDVELRFREKIANLGFNITPQIDRQYFHSLYFREPGGVLFEIATDNPGFTVDEPFESLGQTLKLPPQHESSRSEIEGRLMPLN